MTKLRCKIKVTATGTVMEATPSGYGVYGTDGNFYNRSQYKVLKRWTVTTEETKNDNNSIPS